MTNPTPKQAPEVWKLVETHEPAETFCDYVQSITFDGVVFRVDLGVSRYAHPEADTAPGPGKPGARYISARLVLSPMAALKLHEVLGQTVAELEKRGVLKRALAVPETVQ